MHNAYVRDDEKGQLGYAAIAAYKSKLEAEGKTVILVDSGDALQGGVIGTLSNGTYIADIMDEVGYDFAIPGNHEFDFGMDNFLEIADAYGYEYISCNFIDLRTGETVLDPYKIVEIGGEKIAFIGVSTPETIKKSTPTYFQDAEGNYIYGFCNGENGAELYAAVQKAIDDSAAEGAEMTVLLSHLGTDAVSSPWTSEDVLANTSGIELAFDGHSHSTIEGQEVYSAVDGTCTVLSSTGTKFAAFGEAVIYADFGVKTSLITDITDDDPEVLEFVNGITAEFDDLVNTIVAKSEVVLTTSDPETGNRAVRSAETNLGDLCTDAYRTLLGADIAFVNGGGVRENIAEGDITYGDIIAVNPFGNTICLIETTGQQIIDALELGSIAAGVGESGGFLQVSGLSYTIDTGIPSSVVNDENDMFVKVDGARRVKNVLVDGNPIELDKTYTLASHNYMLKQFGGGYTMFAGSKLLKDEVMIDNQVLINYIVDVLGGVIKADSIYADPRGEGRIKILAGEKEEKTVKSSIPAPNIIRFSIIANG